MNDMQTQRLVEKAVSGEADHRDLCCLLGNMATCFNVQQEKLDKVLDRQWKLILILLFGLLSLAGVKVTEIITAVQPQNTAAVANK